MDYSMTGFPVHHQLPELADSCPMSQWCHPTILSSVIPSPAFNLPQNQGFFQWGSSSHHAAKYWSFSIKLPMNIQDWFPLGLTGLISSQSKGLSRVFSNTTVQQHQFSALSFLYSPTLTSINDYWKKTALTRWMDLCWQRNSSAF